MKRIILLVSILVIQACAFTDATLQVQHDESSNFKGPIVEVNPLLFSSPALVDNRDDIDRIGWKKNGFGMQTADITTANPVVDIVSDSIRAGLIQNGHSVVDSSRVSILGSVDRFWFESDMNFWTVEFTGDIQCRLIFVDNNTKEEIYKSDYSGSYSEKSGGGLNKTWQRVMGKAVDNMVEDVMFDEELVEALSSLID